MRNVIADIETAIRALQEAGIYRRTPVIDGPTVKLSDGREVVNLCSNNYLGLANHPEVLTAAREALNKYGFGTCP